MGEWSVGAVGAARGPDTGIDARSIRVENGGTADVGGLCEGGRAMPDKGPGSKGGKKKPKSGTKKKDVPTAAPPK